jgi:hypothetical protein
MKRLGYEDSCRVLQRRGVILSAYQRHVGRPRYGLPAYQRWNDEVLAAFCRAFHVSFEDHDAAPGETRARLAQLKVVLRGDATLPHPLRGALESSLVDKHYGRHTDALARRATALHLLYEKVAQELARGLWGDLGTRTNADLEAAGLDFAREPKLDDYLDEI